MESLGLMLAVSLALLGICVGKELVESLFTLTDDCTCPSAELDCSVYCVDQTQCGQTLSGNDLKLCYLLDEPLLKPEEQCVGGKIVDNYCLIPRLSPPKTLPPAAEWCHLVHSPNGEGGGAFDFEPEFLASSMAPITSITTFHDSSQWSSNVHLVGLKMVFGDVAASVGRVDEQLQTGECVLAEEEFVHDIIVDWKQTYGLPAPASITFVTNLQTCGPYGPQIGTDTDTYSGERLMYVRGRMGLVTDKLEMIFAWC